MDKLENARKQINQIDKEMAELFEKRMTAVELVAEHKKEHGLSILDSGREQAIIEANSTYVKNPEIRSYYVEFLKNNIELSKKYQHKLLNGMKVAYSGVEGAFANIAARRIFPDGNMISYEDFTSAYESVVSGECDCAVLPVENSYAGEVGQVMDLMFNGSLYVNGVYTLPINHHLLGVKGSSFSDIKKVISHPQALSQCGEYIKKNKFAREQAENTARAAQFVSESNDIHVAAIASEETAALYNLEILDHDINESSVNTTRFAVFSRVDNKMASGKNKFLLMFTVNNIAGALAKAVNVIGAYGFNMLSLRSRPMKELAWQYYFYVEAEGDITSSNGQKMLSLLSTNCDKLKVLGNYAVDINLEDKK